MQPAPGRSEGEVTREGLGRLCSAPASCLEALLEDEEEDLLKPSQCLTDLLADNCEGPSSIVTTAVGFASNTTTGPAATFLRQNSSSANFVGNSSDGSEWYFYGFGIPASLDYASHSNFNSVSSSLVNKRVREVGDWFPFRQLKGLFEANTGLFEANTPLWPHMKFPTTFLETSGDVS
ncbi:transcription factor bHLH80-like [Rosa rugosa]|uniref:transcription factor bHLH80-like n=1 Tax=Rosa rugosa TaxID=74645 RepID=UPI002B40942C|nr:transcription factor bHLH80-like [Rosa rugosa]